jgi:hypothetical protein
MGQRNFDEKPFNLLLKNDFKIIDNNHDNYKSFEIESNIKTYFENKNLNIEYKVNLIEIDDINKINLKNKSLEIPILKKEKVVKQKLGKINKSLFNKQLTSLNYEEFINEIGRFGTLVIFFIQNGELLKKIGFKNSMTIHGENCKYASNDKDKKFKLTFSVQPTILDTKQEQIPLQSSSFKNIYEGMKNIEGIDKLKEFKNIENAYKLYSDKFKFNDYLLYNDKNNKYGDKYIMDYNLRNNSIVFEFPKDNLFLNYFNFIKQNYIDKEPEKYNRIKFMLDKYKDFSENPILNNENKINNNLKF